VEVFVNDDLNSLLDGLIAEPEFSEFVSDKISMFLPRQPIVENDSF
jgi:capsular polysaccharide biosynthesis protein